MEIPLKRIHQANAVYCVDRLEKALITVFLGIAGMIELPRYDSSIEGISLEDWLIEHLLLLLPESNAGWTSGLVSNWKFINRWAQDAKNRSEWKLVAAGRVRVVALCWGWSSDTDGLTTRDITRTVAASTNDGLTCQRRGLSRDMCAVVEAFLG